MQIKAQYRKHSTPCPCRTRRGQRGVFHLKLNQRTTRAPRALILTSAVWAVCALLAMPCSAQNAKLQQATGGIALSGPNGGPFVAGFGSVNGLGIGTPATGLTQIAVSGGEFYYTPYTLVVSGAGGGNPALVKAYISSGFTNSSTVLQLLSCLYPNACNTYASYAPLPVSQATEVTVLPNQANNGNYNAYLGLFVGDTNGSITTPDSIQVTLDIYDGANNHLKHTIVLNLKSPSVTVQTAVQMQLATAASGLTVSLNSATVDPNYTTNFGTVNGLGIGPGAGTSVVSGQVANGSLYATPYVIQPQFSGFTATSNTTITTYVSTNFTHSAILKLYDSGSSNSGYAPISTAVGGTTITSSVTNGANVTRYLGLYVSNANGAGTFTGTDTATLTYTLTVH